MFYTSILFPYGSFFGPTELYISAIRSKLKSFINTFQQLADSNYFILQYTEYTVSFLLPYSHSACKPAEGW